MRGVSSLRHGVSRNHVKPVRKRELDRLLDTCRDGLHAEASRLRHAGASALKVGDEERAIECFAKAAAMLEAGGVVGRASALYALPHQCRSRR